MGNAGSPNGSKVALMGFCIPAMEALDKIGKPFVSVVPPEFGPYMQEHGFEHITWDFGRVNDQSIELSKRLTEMGATVAVPLYETTVEWAGAMNGVFRNDPRLFTRYLLFRDKAMMKRRAQMAGIRVGLFEEADDKAAVLKFFKRVQTALARIDGDVHDPVHLKPLDAAGCMGHRMLRTAEDIDRIGDDEFPCLVETHLDGQEFSCEVFIHNSRIRYLNITEYVHLGYSNFVPASPALEAKRPLIEKAVNMLIKAFDIEYGMIHPEFFLTSDGTISFGEVAARVPGGHIFELIEKACGFNPFVALALCFDPRTTEAELDAFFPKAPPTGDFAGCLMVYPRQKIVTRVAVPESVLNEPYYEKHNLFVPVNAKVQERVAYGDHYGTVYFNGPDSDEMRRILHEYEAADFYTADLPNVPAIAEVGS